MRALEMDQSFPSTFADFIEIFSKTMTHIKTPFEEKEKKIEHKKVCTRCFH